MDIGSGFFVFVFSARLYEAIHCGSYKIIHRLKQMKSLICSFDILSSTHVQDSDQHEIWSDKVKIIPQGPHGCPKS